MYRQIEEVRALWRGEPALRQDSRGREVAVVIHPRPVQAELPVWITSSGNRQTFESAGTLGANLLPHLIGQTVEQLSEKILLYRAARTRAGFAPHVGRVSLMLHTFLGNDLEEVRAQVRQPFREYLRSAVSLEQIAALGGGAVSGGHQVAAHEIRPRRWKNSSIWPSSATSGTRLSWGQKIVARRWWHGWRRWGSTRSPAWSSSSTAPMRSWRAWPTSASCTPPWRRAKSRPGH